MQRDRRDYPSIRKTAGPEEWRLRRAHMGRGLIGLAVVVILTAMLPGPAGAQQVLGEHCWTLNPFVDTLRLAITLPVVLPPTPTTPVSDILELHGRWRATAAAGQQAAGGAGPATYQLLGAGTGTTSVTLPNSIEFGFTAVNNTAFFEGNPSCDLFFVVNNMDLNGTWIARCSGTSPFTAQGTVTFVSPCPDPF